MAPHQQPTPQGTKHTSSRIDDKIALLDLSAVTRDASCSLLAGNDTEEEVGGRQGFPLTRLPLSEDRVYLL